MKLEIPDGIPETWQTRVGNVYRSVSTKSREVRLKFLVAIHQGRAVFLVCDMGGQVSGALQCRASMLDGVRPLAFVPDIAGLTLVMAKAEEALDARDKKAGRK